MELVDTGDLKSPGLVPCRFDFGQPDYGEQTMLPMSTKCGPCLTPVCPFCNMSLGNARMPTKNAEYLCITCKKMFVIPSIFHYNDPEGTESWPFVYLHGQAEDFLGKYAETFGLEWAAPDLISSNASLPNSPGHYLVDLYGHLVLVVLDYCGRNYLRGRASFVDDNESLKHILHPQEWR